MTIGVFDSGIGGLSVANAITRALPSAEIMYREDKENLPYGTRTPDELFKLVLPIIQNMAEGGCDVIVIACNTVTTTLITRLREVIKIPLVGMEPMIKPAALATKTGVIGVFATPTTLASERYVYLKSEFAKDKTIIEPDCSTWALMVEQNTVDEAAVAANITQVLDAGADVIVLGCTHYHWIEDLISELVAGKATVIQPEGPVIERLKTVIAERQQI